MSEWSGKITKVNERDWGSKKIFSWQIAGAPMWFRCESDPCVQVGNCFKFSGPSPNKIDIGSLQEISESDLKEEASEANFAGDPHLSGAAVPPTSSPDYWRWKQIHDLQRQSYFDWRDARADATRIVCAALDNDVLSLGQKKGLKLDVLIGQIKETTEALLERNEDE
jgi:hypothetical protein